MTAATDAFLAKIKPLAIDGWANGQVLPSITGAQAALESSWGNSSLTIQANNLFGIKASNWTGAIYTKETLENKADGTVYTVTADFRAYNNWDESVKDHTAFLQKDRYAPFRGQTDYKLAAQSIKDCGYATDVNYPSKLIKIIEAYGLDKWDTEAINKGSVNTNMAKVYISPSSQHDNVGVGNYGTEETRMNQIADVVEAELKRVGLTTLRNNPSMDITQMVSASNNFGADVHLAIHSNAGGATGAEAYYYTGSTAGKNLASAVYNNLAPMTPTADRGVKATTELYEVWATNAIATLVEIAFHDNWNDASFIINNIQEIGIAIAKGVCSYLGVDFGNSASTTVATNPNRVAVNYERRIVYGGYSIDSKPWGENGHEWWGNTTDFIGRVVKVVEENGTGEYLNTELGWIDKRALIKVSNRFPVSYDATITAGGYSVDSKPWGEDGLENWGNTTDLMYKTFYFYEENGSAEYANGQGLGWVDKRALTKGWISAPVEEAPVEDKLEPPVAEVVPEPVVSASILTLPDGKEWVMYPENGPYTAGDVITLVGGEYQILGDKGNNHLVVNLPNFGQVSILFDESKGATITKKYV